MRNITIHRARKRVTRQRIAGASVMLLSLVFLFCAALKGLYFSFENDNTAFSNLSHSLQRLIYAIYQRTSFLSWFWNWAPVPTEKALNVPGNWGLLFILACGAIGRTIWDSAASLSSRIRKTLQKVEEFGWERELMAQQGIVSGERPNVREITIPLGKEDEWYQRPVGIILLGIAVTVLGQWVNLQFGLVKP
jgi:hypothetical protein